MARWTASAKWAAGPAIDGQRDMPLALRLSEGLGRKRIAEGPQDRVDSSLIARTLSLEPLDYILIDTQ